eukprot:1158193-Pelagomonas_calceolata.AAC.7
MSLSECSLVFFLLLRPKHENIAQCRTNRRKDHHNKYIFSGLAVSAQKTLFMCDDAVSARVTRRYFKGLAYKLTLADRLRVRHSRSTSTAKKRKEKTLPTSTKEPLHQEKQKKEVKWGSGGLLAGARA